MFANYLHVCAFTEAAAVCNALFVIKNLNTCNQCNLLFDTYGFQFYVRVFSFLFTHFNSIWLIVESIAFNQNNINNREPLHKFQRNRMAKECALACTEERNANLYASFHLQMIRRWGTQRAFLCCWFFACLMFYSIFIFCSFSLSKRNFICMHRLYAVTSHLRWHQMCSIHIHLYIRFVWCDILFVNFFAWFFFSPNLVAHWHRFWCSSLVISYLFLFSSLHFTFYISHRYT